MGNEYEKEMNEDRGLAKREEKQRYSQTPNYAQVARWVFLSVSQYILRLFFIIFSRRVISKNHLIDDRSRRGDKYDISLDV